MYTTTRHDLTPTIPQDGVEETNKKPNELLDRYRELVEKKKLNWTSHHRFDRLLGEGGQGTVFKTECRGADGFTLPVAVKVFSPDGFDDARNYDEAMGRIARVSGRVAQIQQDNLLHVQNFVDRSRIRMMVMEWIDGYDLRKLLVPSMLSKVETRVSVKRWEYINRVIVTDGPKQPRMKPGIAVAIVRDCLAGLAALHREAIIHGDIKPSNIMLKRTGNAKIIDIGSAVDMNDPPPMRTCTPTYAAPEVLEGNDTTPQSDLASLGYVLIELMAGQPIHPGPSNYRKLLESKRMLPQRLHELLPDEVVRNDLLMNFCRGLIAPDPMLRFTSAEAAELREEGAAEFQRQLVLSDLSSEYDNEIRLWIEELKEMEEADDDEEETRAQ